jgi:hypothetical protein
MWDFGDGFADSNHTPEDYICPTEIMLMLAGHIVGDAGE